ncbi:hypothetical protein EDEG_03569 [Edhazardia aedis USNM 41457]|uniref:Uncharacterized protein n=1 Tax=Edhazardia aedis (strain USNM 41457) TaxID=1003232 RepID=J9D289_EDHAE|nr:hypothetical protein EDEG_03569 [Edhazardia aedis USNM 41457]|eukprot:EJW01961.1 hypothetical protein EDEG_03569 [Edhazardia aedis USNM 41457]
MKSFANVIQAFSDRFNMCFGILMLFVLSFCLTFRGISTSQVTETIDSQANSTSYSILHDTENFSHLRTEDMLKIAYEPGVLQKNMNLKPQNVSDEISDTSKPAENIKLDINEEDLRILNDMKNKISENNEAIFEQYKIEEIFSGLSKLGIEDPNEEFIWKGRLFRMIRYSDHVKQLSEKFKSIRVRFVDYEMAADSILEFYERHLFFSQFINDKFLYQPITNVSEGDSYCKTPNSIVKAVDVISIEPHDRYHSFIDENRVFIKKYNRIFELFWQKFFVLLNQNLARHTYRSGVEIGSFYELNKNVNTIYDLSLINFRPFINETVQSYLPNQDIKANLMINALNIETYRNFFSEYDSLIFPLNYFLTRCNDEIDFSEMFQTVDEKMTLSQYAINKFNKLFDFVRLEEYRIVGNTLNEHEYEHYDECENKQVKRAEKRSDEFGIFIVVQDFSTKTNRGADGKHNSCLSDINHYIGLYRKNGPTLKKLCRQCRRRNKRICSYFVLFLFLFKFVFVFVNYGFKEFFS